MNSEQMKVRTFFKKFIGANWRSGGIWFLEGFYVFIFLIACLLPVQEFITLVVEDGANSIMLVFVGALGPAIAYTRIQPYTTYMEEQKKRTIFDLVKYYPIDRNEIKKMKTFYMMRFMAKLLPVCMLAQIPITLHDYGTLSIMNFIYIFVVAFLWPVAWGAIAIWTER